ncbi:hypothetical protein N7478_001383 [Penicillium angulare]|uniref:uncharacterized protein n=1 Tax=Penicillium angulare TaxID=116970 RepID=UPI00254118CC|nr:uncharacterized protein N7478_001383 [Penicillium angulare]KAJ5292132.1 hypothetical protein N7478_001383 [Penicillium angulare]
MMNVSEATVPTDLQPQKEYVNRRDATETEIKELPHVVDSIPFVVWIALVVSGAERFIFYAATTPWQNYAQYGADNVSIPGALGLGESIASNVSSVFYAFSFLMSFVFAVLSDALLGRYKTLSFDFVGCLVLFVTSLPSITAYSAKLAGFILAIFLIGLGTGGIKATITPFIGKFELFEFEYEKIIKISKSETNKLVIKGDQYLDEAPKLIITKSGERAVTDRTLTMQYIYNVFYWYYALYFEKFTSIATLSLIASTYLEKQVGYWAAFLLPLCSFSVIAPLLLLWNKKLVKLPPQGSVIPRTAKVILYSARDRFRLDSAKPAYQAERYHKEVDWDDLFVDEIKRGLSACRIMACFIPYHLCNNQSVNNLITQAGEMRLDGVPNDAIKAINPIVCVFLGPIIQKMLYPRLRKAGIPFGPIARMTWAFITMSATMAFAAGVQKLIYSKGPCYDHPLACSASDNGSIPNALSVWVQIPIFVLLGTAEILGFTTLAEYSYSEAPKNMRTLVQSLVQVSSGVGSALGIAVSPVSDDPSVLFLYAGLAAVMFAVAISFWVIFREFDWKSG